jgi:hypothetical protein
MKRKRLVAPKREPWQLERVISGGQVGADIAGLRAAKAAGIPTGGNIPLGFLTLYGMRPEYAELYGLKETISQRYPSRTFLNVKESDATIRFAYRWNSPGELCTYHAVQAFGKPWLDINPLDYSPVTGFDLSEGKPPLVVADWIREKQVRVLNIAGNADEQLEPFVEEFLTEVFRFL